jgi:hypothetical protein
MMQQTQPTQAMQPIQAVKPMSLTGFVILLLGILTFTPEIYISGVMVILVSFSLQLNYFETQRIEQNIVPVNTTPVSAEAYYSW